MTKLLVCVLAGLCLAVQAFNSPPTTHLADNALLTKQKNIYELFWHVDQPTVYHSELYQKARTFSIADNVEHYTDKEAVTTFLDLLKHGMLPRGEIFTVTHPELQREAVTLFRVFYSAKDFDTFYNTAVWARFHVNEYMYIYALSVAVLHRVDTQAIKLPPLYEVLPHFFFNEEVMQKAYQITMGDVGVKKTVGGMDYYVIPTNYTNWYITKHDDFEHKLDYFTQDVGLNAYYFMMSHSFPYWMKNVEHTLSQHRGDYYFYMHHQLLTRYYLERLSNGLGEVDYVSVDKEIEHGYYPALHYRNGASFPVRPDHAVVPMEMHRYVQLLKDLHTRISIAVDSGFVMDVHGKFVDIYTPEGLTILGNIVQGNAVSINGRFYGHLDVLMRKVFGFGQEGTAKYDVVPSALEIFCTSLRDPLFYSLYKNILTYYHRYKEHVPHYTQEQLQFPGVKIESVTVDKLMTYFDHFESMLNNGVTIRNHKEAQNTLIKARQYRLNHKPFTYHINVNSEQNTGAVVRVFLGPKYNEHGYEIDFQNNYHNFVQLDQWTVTLKTGMNRIERSSHESTFVVPDEVPSDVFYKKIKKAIEGTETYSYHTKRYGFPDRLVLPKGRKEGMPFKMFFIVTPVVSTETHSTLRTDLPVSSYVTMDGHPLGYPLDRPFHSHHFLVPNMHLKDVVIYHKEIEDLNMTV